ncbi:hypothetical protein BC828DRAFT_402015 [Blastocladiella britannica]|nr:hypothetical protein BC828DRAFT_402015 [Blastocladiella britannica]
MPREAPYNRQQSLDSYSSASDRRGSTVAPPSRRRTHSGRAASSSSSPSSYKSFSNSSGDSFAMSSSRRSGSISLSIAKSDMETTDGAGGDIAFMRGLSESSWIRQQVYAIVSHGGFNTAILFVIMLNTALLAVQTTPTLNANYGWYLTVLDQIFLGIYLMETGLKLSVYLTAYFKSGWNVFDFIIVVTSVIIRLVRVFRAFRAVRSLRALRAISFLRSLQVLVATLLKSIPAMSSIVSLAFLVLYIFAVIARSLYGNVDKWRFGHIGNTLFRLFAVLTLDDWSTIYLDNREVAPDMFFFLFVFVLLEALFVAVIVSNLDQQGEAEQRSLKRLLGPRSKSANPDDPSGGQRQRRRDTAGSGDPDAQQQAYDESNDGTQPTLPPAGALHGMFEAEWGIDAYYPPYVPLRTKVLAGDYFALCATLERNMQYYGSQSLVIDDLVVLAKGGELDPGGVGGTGAGSIGGEVRSTNAGGSGARSGPVTGIGSTSAGGGS